MILTGRQLHLLPPYVYKGIVNLIFKKKKLVENTKSSDEGMSATRMFDILSDKEVTRENTTSFRVTRNREHITMGDTKSYISVSTSICSTPKTIVLNTPLQRHIYYIYVWHLCNWYHCHTKDLETHNLFVCFISHHTEAVAWGKIPQKQK